MRIALDAMGGDNAPREIIKGAVSALHEYDDVDITLVGNENIIKAELENAGGADKDFQIVHAEDVIAMDESPVTALRRKSDNSIQKAIELLKMGEVSAVVSAGNTGATVAASMMTLGYLPGVKRAGIAIDLPVGTSYCTIIDVGSNIQCKPLHLYQYAVMASVYAELIHDVTSPTVGLLNVGQENAKGTKILKEAFTYMEKDPSLNFVGNVEGREIFKGNCNILVCEGFVGNVMLKMFEGWAENILALFEDKMETRNATSDSCFLDVYNEIKNKIDCTEYGGAPLLGVNGVMIKSHGNSRALAIKNSIKAASKFCNTKLNDKIIERLN